MLYDELLAGPASEKIALIDQDKMVTYGELRRKVDHWARFLQQAGLQKGQRVGLFSRNCAEFVEAYFAVIRAGGVIVPLNFQLVPREIAFMARDTEMKLLISREPLPMDEALAEAGIAGLQQFVLATWTTLLQHRCSSMNGRKRNAARSSTRPGPPARRKGRCSATRTCCAMPGNTWMRCILYRRTWSCASCPCTIAMGGQSVSPVRL